jgi:predicted aldo/keto reductase-like oxidoreductase
LASQGLIQEEKGMNYRELGKTGLKLSEIGLGCEGFVDADDALSDAIFELALQNGVNCLDMYTPDPAAQKKIGRGIAPVRKDFILQGHLCTQWRNGQYEETRKLQEVKDAFEAMLHNLGTDYVDVGNLHYVDSLETWQKILDNGVLNYALELKAAGRIRYLSMSSHNPIVALEAVKTGHLDALLFSINPCYDLLPGNEDCETLWADESYEKPLFNLDPVREELYETCQRLGVGITVMKAFGGGDLLSEEYSPAGKAMTAVECLHYALTRPAVASVMCGAKSVDDLKASLAYETASDEEKDYAATFASFPKISWKGYCMYCGHCAPCPVGIDVADVTKFLNLTKAQKMVPETVAQHYSVLKAHGGDCIGCGSCEKRCPFEVPIRENMKAAKAVFGY